MTDYLDLTLPPLTLACSAFQPVSDLPGPLDDDDEDDWDDDEDWDGDWDEDEDDWNDDEDWDEDWDENDWNDDEEEIDLDEEEVDLDDEDGLASLEEVTDRELDELYEADDIFDDREAEEGW